VRVGGRRVVGVAERRTMAGGAIAGTRHSQDALSSPSNKGGSLDSARPDCLSDATRDREELWIWGKPTLWAA
jgi:hypothetical protein